MVLGGRYSVVRMTFLIVVTMVLLRTFNWSRGPERVKWSQNMLCDWRIYHKLTLASAVD